MSLEFDTPRMSCIVGLELAWWSIPCWLPFFPFGLSQNLVFY